jgi:hypothetical protein
MKKSYLLLLLLCALSVLLLGGCQIEADRGEKPGPDWSRGLRLGQTGLRQPVALQADANGHVHLVWIDLSLPGRLRYAHLDRQAHVFFNEQLDIDLPNLRRPQLLVDSENRLHLAWLSRQEGVQRLYHTLVSPDGQVGDLLPLAGGNEEVNGFQMYLAPGGDVAFVWARELEDGTSDIVHVFLDDLSSPVALVKGGIDPYVLADRAGAVHLTWLTEDALTARTIYYAELRDVSHPALWPATGQKLADFTFPEGGTYYGPVLGVDERNVYVIWSIQNLGGGLTPTSAFSYYVTFEFGAYGEPGTPIPRARPLVVSDEAQPVYAEHAYPAGTVLGGYGFTGLAPLSARVSGGSDFVNTPATVTSQQGELPVALSVLTHSRAESQIRLATAVLSGGEPVGYQLASKALTASLMPSLAADADADREVGLHLAWLDTAGFREFDVYYASTAPDARRWLDRTSTDDLVMGAADLVFGVFSGLGLLPIAGIWTFPAMVWVVVFFIASGKEEMARTPTKVGFAVAVVLYVGVKILLLPGLFAGTPFLHQVPPSWAVALGIAVPALILCVALAAVYVYVRRAERATIFVAYLVFALTDVVLTLALYSPGFFGTS